MSGNTDDVYNVYLFYVNVICHRHMTSHLYGSVYDVLSTGMWLIVICAPFTLGDWGCTLSLSWWWVWDFGPRPHHHHRLWLSRQFVLGWRSQPLTFGRRCVSIFIFSRRNLTRCLEGHVHSWTRALPGCCDRNRGWWWGRVVKNMLHVGSTCARVFFDYFLLIS